MNTTVVNNQKEDAYRVVKVFETQGDYNTAERDSVGTLDAYSVMNLQNKDIVSTGVDSNMRLSLDGNKYILLDQNTKLELVAENTATDSKTIVELREGEILNEIDEQSPPYKTDYSGISEQIKNTALRSDDSGLYGERVHGDDCR